MWKKVAKFKGAEYFRKALYLYLLWNRNPSTEASQLTTSYASGLQLTGHQLTFSSESSRQFEQRDANQSITDLFIFFIPGFPPQKVNIFFSWILTTSYRAKPQPWLIPPG